MGGGVDSVPVVACGDAPAIRSCVVAAIPVVANDDAPGVRCDPFGVDASSRQFR
jgi:hypothetical protein